MEERIRAGYTVRLKSGGAEMGVQKVSDDGLVAYCSWVGDGNVKYVNVAFLTSVLEVVNAKIMDADKIA